MGKSAIIATLAGSQFLRGYYPTFGVRESCVRIGGKLCTLVEFSGQEKCAASENIDQTEDCTLALLVRETESRTSERNLRWWRKQLLANTKCTKILCLQNKCDLDVQDSIEAPGEVRISARSGEGIDVLVEKIKSLLDL